VTDRQVPSPLELLRDRYDQLDQQGPQTIKLAVTYGVSDGEKGQAGMLVEYGLPDYLKTREIAKRWERSDNPKWELYAAAEQLAATCVDIWARDEANGQEIDGFPGKWSPGLGAGEGKVGFVRAAELLGRPVNSEYPYPELQAVTAVLRFDTLIDEHERLVGMWEPAPPRGVGHEFVGESSPATGSSPS
jgi:hypothetical protein